MCQRIFRLVYCSRSQLPAVEAVYRPELLHMLGAGRRSNAQAAVTGALFFDTRFFAGALEGDYVAVQRTFERVARDPRHAQVTILLCGFAAGRAFGDWSLAFAAATGGGALPFGRLPRPEAEFTGSSGSGEAVLQFLRDRVTRREYWSPLAAVSPQAAEPMAAPPLQ